jgi:hypothetical protein
MIMGGGKTKVLLPILAKQKANGDTLSILVVPTASFDTNLADLNSSSMQVFGQRGKAFIFQRNQAPDAQASKKILNYLERARTNGDYIVTTAESMQSLQLKYYELLAHAPGPTLRPLR